MRLVNLLHKRKRARKARITANPCPTTTRMKRGEGEVRGKTVAGETDGGQRARVGKERRKEALICSGPFAASVVVAEEREMKIVGEKEECHPSRLRLAHEHDN